MHFPSLAVLTTFACAAFSYAAPLNPSPNPAAVDELGSLVPRDGDTPAVATDASPLAVSLTALAADLQPALDGVVKCVAGKISVEVDIGEVKTAILTVVAVVASHVDDIKKAALLSVDNIQAHIIATLLLQILAAVYTALNTVLAVPGIVNGVLDPVIAQVNEQLVVVLVVVKDTVPGVVVLVVDGVTALYDTVSHLSLAVIFEALGVAAPFS